MVAPTGFEPASLPRGWKILSFLRFANFATVPFGAPGGDRTRDTRIKSPVLYQLSYERVWSIVRESDPPSQIGSLDPSR